MRIRTIFALGATFCAGTFLDMPIAFGQATATAEAPAAASDAPGCSLGIASVANLRDLGGFTTRDGMVVRKKLLYRSNQLARISADDMKRIELLGLKNDYDLRRTDERDSAPDRLPAGVNNIWLNVMIDTKQKPLPSFGQLVADPKQANIDYGDGKMIGRFLTVYKEFVSLLSAQAAYHRMFTDLQSEENLPALFHCTSGKDRTGWAAAVLLLLLGVPEEVVMADYLRSNEYMLTPYRRTLDNFKAAGGDPDILAGMVGVKAEYLKSGLDEMRTKYGTIEEYFAKGLQIDAAGQQALKERFLTRSPQ